MSTTEDQKKQYQVPATSSEKIAWQKRIMADRSISLGAKVIANRLAFYHNDETGQCNPRQKVLADAVGLERKTVNVRLRELEAGGWISSHQTRGASFYVLNVHRTETEVSGYTDTSRRRVPRKMDQSTDTRCLPAGTAGVRLPGQQVSAGRDTELLRELPKGTIKLNDGADAHRQQHEIEDKAVPDHRRAIVPDNDNHGLPEEVARDFAFFGEVVGVTHAEFARYEQAFPHLNLRESLRFMDDHFVKAGIEASETIDRIEPVLAHLERKEIKRIAGSKAA